MVIAKTHDEPLAVALLREVKQLDDSSEVTEQKPTRQSDRDLQIRILQEFNESSKRSSEAQVSVARELGKLVAISQENGNNSAVILAKISALEISLAGLRATNEAVVETLKNDTLARIEISRSSAETAKARWAHLAKLGAAITGIIASALAGGYFVSCGGPQNQRGQAPSPPPITQPK